MLYEISASTSQTMGTATVPATRVFRVCKWAARAVSARMWRAAEADCEVTLRRYAHWISGPDKRALTPPGASDLSI